MTMGNHLENESIMIDRVLDYNLKIDNNDNIIKHLSKDETVYHTTLNFKISLAIFNSIDISCCFEILFGNIRLNC